MTGAVVVLDYRRRWRGDYHWRMVIVADDTSERHTVHGTAPDVPNLRELAELWAGTQGLLPVTFD